METAPLFIGFMFLVMGGLFAVRPDLLIKLQIWVQRVVMGAEYIPSERTHTVVRIMGAIFVVIGLLVLTGVFGTG